MYVHNLIFCSTEVTGMGKNPTRKVLFVQNVLLDRRGVTTTCVVRFFLFRFFFLCCLKDLLYNMYFNDLSNFISGTEADCIGGVSCSEFYAKY